MVVSFCTLTHGPCLQEVSSVFVNRVFVSGTSRRFHSAEFLQFHREPFWLKVIRARTSTSLNIRALNHASCVDQFARIGFVRNALCWLPVTGKNWRPVAIVSHVGKRYHCKRTASAPSSSVRAVPSLQWPSRTSVRKEPPIVPCQRIPQALIQYASRYPPRPWGLRSLQYDI